MDLMYDTGKMKRNVTLAVVKLKRWWEHDVSQVHPLGSASWPPLRLLLGLKSPPSLTLGHGWYLPCASWLESQKSQRYYTINPPPKKKEEKSISKQGSTNCSMLPSRMGEHGVSWEIMENKEIVENMEKMENINQMTLYFLFKTLILYLWLKTLFGQSDDSIHFILRFLCLTYALG